MTEQPRPPAVTLACLFIGASSFMLLIELWGTLSNWGSLELQDAMAKALKDSPVTGISVDEAMRWLQIALYVAVPLTVAGFILSIYTARRDHAARIGLTVICVLAGVAFLSAGVLGLLPAMLAFACGWMLWSPPARDWFAGRAPADPAATHPALIDPSTMPPPATTPARPAHDPAVPGSTPREAITAGVLALIGSLLAGSSLVLIGSQVALRRLSPAEFEKNFGSDPLLVESMLGIESTPQVDAAVIAVCVILAALAGVATLLSIALLTGKVWARRPLLVLSLITIPLSAAVFPAGLPIVAMATICAILLNRPAARRWR